MALKKENWQPDVVYLVQFPRTHSIPSGSPYCMKLETWLRIADVPYENIDGGLTGKSQKGFMPFIELNGRQIGDTYFIINELTKRYRKEYMEQHLTDSEKAQARAFETLVEGELNWITVVNEANGAEQFFSNQLYGIHLTGITKLLKPYIISKTRKGLKGRAFAQGMGRHAEEERRNIAEKDLKALNDFIGKKKFILGDKPTRLDATVFGHIIQFLYSPIHPVQKQYMERECGDLINYLMRVKAIYWPDWDEACRTLSMSTKWKA